VVDLASTIRATKLGAWVALDTKAAKSKVALCNWQRNNQSGTEDFKHLIDSHGALK